MEIDEQCFVIVEFIYVITYFGKCRIYQNIQKMHFVEIGCSSSVLENARNHNCS